MTTLPPGSTLYRSGDLVIDRERMQATRAGVPLDLPGLTFDALLVLVERAPALVRHAELVDAVWRGAWISDETITQRISLLRRALGDDPAAPVYVATVRGRGYRWLLPVVPATVPGRAAPASRRRRLAAAAVLLLVALGAGLAWEHAGSRTQNGPPLPAARPSETELTRRGWIYLARHRKSDNEVAVGLFRRALHADGAAPAARVGLSLALSQRATKFNGAARWAVEAETLARQALAARRDADAYHALGLALDAQGRISPALAAYRRAAELDPGHAGAVASAAYLLYVQGELAEALRWDLRALRLDADLPYVEIQIAEVLAVLGRPAAAEAWYRRALALRPDNVFVHGTFAARRLAWGDRDGAEATVRRAIDLGVRRPEPRMVLGHLAWLRGDLRDAQRHYRRAEALNARQSAAGAYLAALAAAGPTPRAGTATAVPCRRPPAAGEDEWPGTALASAVACAGSGDRQAAFDALDAAIERGYRDGAWLRVDPAIAPLRGDPDFAARLDRIRRLVAAETRRLHEAPWLPAGLW